MRARIIVRMLERLQLRMQRLSTPRSRPGEPAPGQPCPGGPAAGQPGRPLAHAGWQPPDARRSLQLGLAGVWLLDAVLQCQSVMFTPAFGQMLATAAAGNPHLVATPIGWSARIIEHDPAATNAAFAGIQFLIAFGIAWRPAVRAALAVSVGWALGVWWLGEGLGGVLAGTANPVTGAPGAVILYALLAVLLWPADRDPLAPFLAGRAVGRHVARSAWMVLWGSLAWFALASRAPLGELACVSLTSVLVVVAVGVFLPARLVRVTLVLATVTAVAIWVPGEALGDLSTGSATDPNSGPLLILLALAYWPWA